MIEAEKAVLLSIQPKWCELIASGKKTIEVRKTKPKLSTPFKCYIYCTKPKSKHDLGICLDEGRNVGFVYNCNYDAATRYGMQILSGKVIGEFVCDEITSGFWIAPFTDYLQSQSCLSYDEVCDYANGKPIFSWHISDLVIYDKPKELCEFSKPNICRRGRQKHQCIGCWDCEIKRPPQSWCYVERLEGKSYAN